MLTTIPMHTHPVHLDGYLSLQELVFGGRDTREKAVRVGSGVGRVLQGGAQLVGPEAGG